MSSYLYEAILLCSKMLQRYGRVYHILSACLSEDDRGVLRSTGGLIKDLSHPKIGANYTAGLSYPGKLYKGGRDKEDPWQKEMKSMF